MKLLTLAVLASLAAVGLLQECADQYVCSEKVAAGQCTSDNEEELTYMKANCARSCGFCDEQCYDGSPFCYEEVQKDKAKCDDAFFKSECRLSCGDCTVRKTHDCQEGKRMSRSDTIADTTGVMSEPDCQKFCTNEYTADGYNYKASDQTCECIKADFTCDLNHPVVDDASFKFCKKIPIDVDPAPTSPWVLAVSYTFVDKYISSKNYGATWDEFENVEYEKLIRLDEPTWNFLINWNGLIAGGGYLVGPRIVGKGPETVLGDLQGCIYNEPAGGWWGTNQPDGTGQCTLFIVNTKKLASKSCTSRPGGINEKLHIPG